MPKLVTSTVLVAGGVIIGFFLGRITFTTPQPPTTPDPIPIVATPPQTVHTTDPDMEQEEALSPAPADLTLQSALRLPSGEDRDIALERLGIRAALNSPEEATAALAQLGRMQDKELFLMGYIEALAGRDGSACLDFLAALPQGILRTSGIGQALEIIALDDPAHAASRVAELLTGESAQNALFHITEIWSHSDPVGALEWIVTQKGGNLRSAGIEQIAISWAENSPAQAASALSQSRQISPAEKDIALRAVLGTWALDQPEAAIQWAHNHASALTSERPATMVYMNWAAQEPARAAAALAKESNPELLAAAVPFLALIWGESAPLEASKWVLTLPANATRTAAALQLLDKWMEIDPHGAQSWANKLPPENGLRDAAEKHLNETQAQAHE